MLNDDNHDGRGRIYTQQYSTLAEQWRRICLCIVYVVHASVECMRASGACAQSSTACSPAHSIENMDTEALTYTALGPISAYLDDYCLC